MKPLLDNKVSEEGSIKLSPNIIGAAQAREKHDEYIAKQEETLGWCIPGYEDVKAKGSIYNSNIIDPIYINCRKSYGSFNVILDKHYKSIISRRNNELKARNESHEISFFSKINKIK
ncbi:hypothetical protein ACR3K2_09790 [Cryptosporidium serpentis]